MPAIAFFGYPEELAHAAPANIRAELSLKLRVIGPDFCVSNWLDHAATMSEIDVIFATWGVPAIDQEFLSYAKRLRAVFYAAGSLKSLATDTAFSRGIIFSSAWNANAIPVAEYAIAAILLSLKQFWHFSRNIKKSRTWLKSRKVAGGYFSTVGLVSLGAIGRRVAALLANHDLRVVAYDPFLSPQAALSLE